MQRAELNGLLIEWATHIAREIEAGGWTGCSPLGRLVRGETGGTPVRKSKVLAHWFRSPVLLHLDRELDADSTTLPEQQRLAVVVRYLPPSDWRGTWSASAAARRYQDLTGRKQRTFEQDVSEGMKGLMLRIRRPEG